MNTIVINGVTISSGRSISVVGNKVFVDGKDVTPDAKDVHIQVTGNVEKLQADACNGISVTGDVGSIATQSGDVEVGGNVGGSIQTMSGDVDCGGSVTGSASSMSGSIRHRQPSHMASQYEEKMPEKPHHGRIKSWRKEPCDSGIGFIICGEFLDHPAFRGPSCHTSAVVAYDEATGEIETRNSRYRLVADGEPTRLRGCPWRGDKMRFLGKNGYDHEREAALKVFKIGEEYEVESCEVGDFHHIVVFVGIPGRWNGVMFDSVAVNP